MSMDLPLTPEDVNEIAAILDGTPYEHLDIRTARFRLRVARDGEGWSQEWDFSEGEVAAAGVVATPDSVASAAPDGHAVVPSPLPGTFYHAPQPGAPPFVTVGSRVTPDTVVGIVETMKLMNPVHAGVSGTIAAILVDNAVMVAGHETLLHVKLD